jgi:Caspase domain
LKSTPATGIEQPFFMAGRLIARYEQAYYELINELAQQIERYLRELPAPRKAPAPRRRRFALLIGNDRFEPESGLQDLTGARNAVSALEAVLRDPALGSFEVATLTDQPRNVVIRALDKALSETDRGDMMLLFYSGQGMLDHEGRLCLAMADTQTTALYATSIRTTDLNDLIANSNCGQVVLLLDCSYSEALDREIDLGRGESQPTPMRREGAQVFVLAMSAAYQTSREVETEAAGQVVSKFTDALIEGIATGAADIDQDGNITIRELYHYLSEILRAPRPQYWAAGMGDPVIAHVRGGNARRRVAAEAQRKADEAPRL